MDNSKIVIVGRTRSDRENITSLFLRHFSGSRRVDSLPSEITPLRKGDVVVFASSQDRFLDVLNFCQTNGNTLIVVSSGISLPEGFFPMMPIIMAPNLALLICALFEVLPELGALAQKLGARTQVVEAHQATKTSAAVTASRMAAAFGVSEEEIGHIRSNAVAGAILSVPSEHFGGFAQHFIAITVAGVKVTIRTEIIGRDAYAEGLALLLQKMEKAPPSVGVHEAQKIVFA